MASCDTHPFDPAVGTCRTCGRDYCASCLVYAFGDKKPPFCVPCALEAAGVRKSNRKERKARRGLFAFGGQRTMPQTTPVF